MTRLARLCPFSAFRVSSTSFGSSSTSRMFLMYLKSVSIEVFVLLGYGKVKGRTAVNHAFGPGPAAVPLNDALDIGQPDARALEFVLAVQALKHAKQLVGITRVETCAVVADENHRF